MSLFRNASKSPQDLLKTKIQLKCVCVQNLLVNTSLVFRRKDEFYFLTWTICTWKLLTPDQEGSCLLFLIIFFRFNYISFFTVLELIHKNKIKNMIFQVPSEILVNWVRPRWASYLISFEKPSPGISLFERWGLFSYDGGIEICMKQLLYTQ